MRGTVARDGVGFDGLNGGVVWLGSGKPGEERAEEDRSGLSGYVRRWWGKVVSFMARVGRLWEELGQCAHGLMMSLSAAADCVSAVNLDDCSTCMLRRQPSFSQTLAMCFQPRQKAVKRPNETVVNLIWRSYAEGFGT